jgi:ubiquinone/menaquinone biosynthesis C-methylase UbiE
MLTRLLHCLVAQPRVYDLCQLAAGAAYVRSRLARRILPLRETARIVVDVGGGTGAARALWGRSTRYVCLDNDPLKLRGYLAREAAGLAVLADATRLPLPEGGVDAIVCTAVTHHLSDVQLDEFVGEAARVLKPRGRLILLDALWRPDSAVSRLFWKYDRGANPRTADTLWQSIARHFDMIAVDSFRVWHAYNLFIASPRAPDDLCGSTAVRRR